MPSLLAERLSSLRLELFGDRGGPEMARRLEIPVRTWYNYEGGVTVPAEVVLRIIELTSVEPVWLLHGKGLNFASSQGWTSTRFPTSRRWPSAPCCGPLSNCSRPPARRLLAATRHHPRPNGPVPEPPQDSPARREWLEAQQENRCIQVKGIAMAPILADGAFVAYTKEGEDPRQLDGKLVVVRHHIEPTIRWFSDCGRYAPLRAENPANGPAAATHRLRGASEQTRMRRVLWIDTAH